MACCTYRLATSICLPKLVASPRTSMSNEGRIVRSQERARQLEQRQRRDAYCAGAMYNFGHSAIRAESEAYDVDKLDDLYAVTGSLQYTFFREKEKPAGRCDDTDRHRSRHRPRLRRSVRMVTAMVYAMPLTSARPRRRVRKWDAVAVTATQAGVGVRLRTRLDLDAATRAKIDAMIPVLKNPKVAFIAARSTVIPTALVTTGLDLGSVEAACPVGCRLREIAGCESG